MSRAGRLAPVQHVIDETERRHATQLAASERRVAACEARLTELSKYEADYRNNFHTRVSSGMSSAELRDYQTFLARLTEAVRQQTHAVTKARLERDAQRLQWQLAAQRAKAVEHVIGHWQAEERLGQNRREQRDSDERAQRTAPGNAGRMSEHESEQSND